MGITSQSHWAGGLARVFTLVGLSVSPPSYGLWPCPELERSTDAVNAGPLPPAGSAAVAGAAHGTLLSKRLNTAGTRENCADYLPIAERLVREPSR